VTESSPASQDDTLDSILTMRIRFDAINPVLMVIESLIEISHSSRGFTWAFEAWGNPHFLELQAQVTEGLWLYGLLEVFIVPWIRPYAWFKQGWVVDFKSLEILEGIISIHVIPDHDVKVRVLLLYRLTDLHYEVRVQDCFTCFFSKELTLLAWS
jgi:hypothetical protein